MRLPHLMTFRDRHGKTRRYVRNLAAGKQIPIAVAPDDPMFLPAYRAALAALDLPPNRLHAMHVRVADDQWHHWQIARTGTGRWHRVMRTKCGAEAAKPATKPAL
jgi:hypothetical protein